MPVRRDNRTQDRTSGVTFKNRTSILNFVKLAPAQKLRLANINASYDITMMQIRLNIPAPAIPQSFTNIMLSKICGNMKNITAGGIETEQNIQFLFCTPPLERHNEWNRFNVFRGDYFSLVLLFGCPDFFADTALNALCSPRVMTIANSFVAITFRTKMAVF